MPVVPRAYEMLHDSMFPAVVLLVVSAASVEAGISSHDEQENGSRSWERLLVEAERLQVPTKFLRVVPPDFIHFEFDELRTYAAEYHPGEHRMLLNRTLSLNAAGRVLKPLGRMTHKELEVFYHELFHAYMDYITVRDVQLGSSGAIQKHSCSLRKNSRFVAMER